MDERSETRNALIISYMTLRKTLGVLGTIFPFILFAGGLVLFRTTLQYSLSTYYHTGMRDVFVGFLCAIGVFLIAYKGYDKRDNIAGTLGGIFAVGVALFSIIPEGAPETSMGLFIETVHYVCAVAFFLTLAYFSLFLFTEGKQIVTEKKRKRNVVYRICGYVIVISIALIPVYYFLPDDIQVIVSAYKPVFWLEAIAIVAFGISWLTKGEAIALLNDEVPG